jgi:hypothetical protein
VSDFPKKHLEDLKKVIVSCQRKEERRNRERRNTEAEGRRKMEGERRKAELFLENSTVKVLVNT